MKTKVTLTSHCTW